MSMPSIPEFKHRPSQKETVIDLLESIALEEIALAHLINSEAEKNQAFVGKITCHKLMVSDCEIERYSETIRKMIDTTIMKEWILLKKLETVLEIEIDCHKKQEECCEEEHRHCQEHHHHKHCDRCICECHCECECQCRPQHHKCRKHSIECD